MPACPAPHYRLCGEVGYEKPEKEPTGKISDYVRGPQKLPVLPFLNLQAWDVVTGVPGDVVTAMPGDGVSVLKASSQVISERAPGRARLSHLSELSKVLGADPPRR